MAGEDTPSGIQVADGTTNVDLPPSDLVPEKPSLAPSTADQAVDRNMHTLMAGIASGRPINVFGYMGGGKTTFANALRDNYQYRVIDETAWDTILGSVATSKAEGMEAFKNEWPSANDRLAISTVVGKGLIAAYTDIVHYLNDKRPACLEHKVFNCWMEHMDCAINVYFLVRSDQVLREERGITDDLSGHFRDIEAAVTKYNGNDTIVVCTPEARDSLMAVVLGEEE